MNSEKLTTTVAVVGAGSAGLNAAVRLAKAGVSVCLIDENDQPGGVVYRGPLREETDSNHLDSKLKGNIARVRGEYQKYADQMTYLGGTQVVGGEVESNKLILLNQTECYELEYEFLLICTGCHEKAVPFPGWTLPGVMSIGGIQLQVKSGLVKPGGRIALVGTGPLLPVAAKQVHLAGVDVVGVFEAGRRVDLVKSGMSLLANKSLLGEGLSYLNYLRAQGIKFRYGWGIVEARGNEQLEEVVVAPYDKEWRPQTRHQISFKVDTLGVAYGFQPRSQLTQLLNIEHEFDHFSGLRPVRDELGRVSRKNTFCAGDSAGINGSEVATRQGVLAALGILVDLGHNRSELDREIDQVQKELKPKLRFSGALEKFSTPKKGLLELADANTTVCRCENVSFEKIEEAVSRGVNDITSLKMATRVGMGDCQGKICSGYCYDLLREKTGKDDIGRLRPRFPLAPLPFGSIKSKTEELV